MEITVVRRFQGPEYTIGGLHINGEYLCDTLEDTVRDLRREAKMPGRTAIPAGTYRVMVDFSPRFKRGLPRLYSVPHFEGVLIHRGNTPEDTSGCILVGENRVKGKVVNSTHWEIRITDLIRVAIAAGETVQLTIA